MARRKRWFRCGGCYVLVTGIVAIVSSLCTIAFFSYVDFKEPPSDADGHILLDDFKPSAALLDFDLPHRQPTPGRSLEASYVYVDKYDEARVGAGCVTVGLKDSSVKLQLYTAACNNHRCPTCYIISEGSTVHNLTLQNCSRMLLHGNTQIGTGLTSDRYHKSLHEFTFLNLDQATSAKIVDGKDSVVSIPARRSAKALCYTHGDNTLFFFEAAAVGTTTPAPSPPPYVKNDGTSNDCPTGSSPITTEADCNAAIAYFGGDLFANSPFDSPSHPPGCWQGAGSNTQEYVFNKDLTGMGAFKTIVCTSD